MTPDSVYLDYAASTPIDDRVIEAMAPHHGAANPSSAHAAGRAAAEQVDRARLEVAMLMGVSPGEIVFTSGATEADNLAIAGVLQAAGGGHVVTNAAEHNAVLQTAIAWCPSATVLAVDHLGHVDPAEIAEALRPDTVLVSVMAANNEVGTLADLAEIGELCRRRGVLFHTDAAQAAGKISLDVSSLPVDLLSMSAHKMYGPKGVGALWVSRRSRDRIAAIAHGGGHERGLRSGTLNVAGCVGFGEAARLAREQEMAETTRALQLRSHLKTQIQKVFPIAVFNGDQQRTVPGIVNVRLPGIDAESLLLATPTVAASTGSACTSAVPIPSHVLTAMGRSYEEAGECIRLSFGRFTTETQIDRAIEAFVASAALLLEEPTRVAP